jgi:hypothetical protein
MCSTGSLPEFESECKDLSKCEPLTYDDSKCASVCKCCVGMSDYGESNKCISACRKCRNFGNTWQPRRPMRALNYTDMYTDRPGYATTGDYVEHFGVSDNILNNPLALFALIAMIIFGSTMAGYTHFTNLEGIIYSLVIFFAYGFMRRIL